MMTTDELQKLLDAATPGEWTWDETVHRLYVQHGDFASTTVLMAKRDFPPKWADAEGMAQWRDLAAEVIALRARVAAADALAEAAISVADAADECDDCGYDDNNQAPVDAGQCRALRIAIAFYEAAK